MATYIDPRLLQFAPFYRALFLRNNPGSKGLSDEQAEKALLAALRKMRHLKEVRAADGTLRLEPTDEYLKSIEKPV